MGFIAIRLSGRSAWLGTGPAFQDPNVLTGVDTHTGNLRGMERARELRSLSNEELMAYSTDGSQPGLEIWISLYCSGGWKLEKRGRSGRMTMFAWPSIQVITCLKGYSLIVFYPACWQSRRAKEASFEYSWKTSSFLAVARPCPAPQTPPVSLQSIVSTSILFPCWLYQTNPLISLVTGP